MNATASIGHNSGDASGDIIKSFVERIERGEQEKKDAATFVSGIYAEAKSRGFDAPTIRKVVKLRRQNAEKRREDEALLELYKSAVGLD